MLQRVESLVAVCLSLSVGTAWAQQSSGAAPAKSSGGGTGKDLKAPEFTLAQDAPASQKAPARKEPAPKEHVQSEGEHYSGPYHYREISDFFNIREAYSNVERGEWEFE